MISALYLELLRGAFVFFVVTPVLFVTLAALMFSLRAGQAC